MNTIWKINENKEVELRLNVRQSIALEKALKVNPLNILMGVEDGKLPSLTDMLTIIHYGIRGCDDKATLNDVYDLYDEYIQADNSQIELMNVIITLFKDSGYIGKEGDEEGGSPN